MFKKSRVSLGGRLIITAIFGLAVFAPEILIMTTGVGVGMSIIRLLGGVFLYYFTMLGHGWARWITAFLLIIAAALFIGVAGKHATPLAIGAAVIFIPSIAILLGLKTVQPRDRTRSRRSL